MAIVDMAARAKELATRLTPEQRERYARVTARNNAIQACTTRGPNAPKDKTFGGQPRERKAAA